MLYLAKRAIAALLMGSIANITNLTSAITEDTNGVNLRDASASQDRPRIEGYDMDEEVSAQVE
jgi:hypothetical protein